VSYQSPEDYLANDARVLPPANGAHMLTREPAKSAREAFDERNPRPIGEPRESGAKKFTLVPWGESTFDPNEEWRVKHVIPLKGVGLIYGKSQSLKSFVAMHLALSVALGEPWAGKRVKKAAVVYLCAEGQGRFPKRVAGLTKARSIRGEVDVHIVYTVPNLGTMDGDLDALIASIESAGIKPGLIVVDTTAKTIGSAEENGPGMAAFVWNAGRYPSISDASCSLFITSAMARMRKNGLADGRA
jgi:hypothetical protein